MRATLLAAAMIAGACGCASAQTAEDLARLERMSRERGDAVAARNMSARGVRQMPPPPRAEEDKVRPLRGLWRCSGAAEGQTVYAAPDEQSPPIGRSTAFVATQGNVTGGFVQILHSNGDLGYVPAGTVLTPDGDLRGLIGADGRSLACNVLGVREGTGSPVFQLR